MFSALLDGLSVLVETAQADADQIIAGKSLHGETEAEEACLAYWVLKACANQQGEKTRDLEIRIAHSYARGTSKHDDALEYFKDIFLEPLYEYLDEQLDDQRAILALIRRYKHKCEWFQREKLLAVYDEEKQRTSIAGRKSRGEKQLALNLYEYLHDQGLDFSIEPSSYSGEADLICAQNSDDPLVADVKIFDPSAGKNKAYVISGFHQVYQYTLDYNEPFGYLVIFKTCQEGLAITSSQQEQSTQFVTWNGKTIFFVVIDLYAHEKSASQRGKHKSYVISEDEFVTQQVETEEPHEVDAADTGNELVTHVNDSNLNTTEVNE
ncbi:MAG: hypothetical protein IT422_22480 [Pirellulaceae bacterium]|nr:hypothetical protein [Pirellulaceae bacterium]